MAEIYNQGIVIDPYDQNKLFQSYRNNDYVEFCRLIDDGANVNCFDQFGESLIGVIIQDPHSIKDNVKFFDKLMSSKVCVEQTNGDYDPLTMAIKRQDDLHYMEKILEKTKQFNKVRSRKFSKDEEPYGPPIFDALLTKNMDKINLLLKYDVDLTVCNWSQIPILSFLLEEFKYDQKFIDTLFPILLEKGAVVDDPDLRGRKTINYWAIHNGSEKIFNLLMENNANINSRNIYGNTVIWEASLEQNYKAVFILIKNNANLNVQNKQGVTPLMIALDQSDWKTAGILFESNSDISLCDNYGNNLAHYLVFSSNPKYASATCIAKSVVLLKKNPNLLYVKNKEGKTPMDVFEKVNKEEYLKFKKSLDQENQKEMQ